MINYSQASENNKHPILAQLSGLFAAPGLVLEVGSGAGQHAIHFAGALPHLTWQPTDQGGYFEGLRANIRTVRMANILDPIYLDIADAWPERTYDYGFSANVLHIAPARLIDPFFAGFARCITANGTLCVYGPFKYNGQFTTESNARFDLWLKDNNAESGVRDVEVVNQIAMDHGFTPTGDIAMPANNQMLVFQRGTLYG